MVPLLRPLDLEPMSTIERGEPHFANTVDAGLPIQTILFPLLQRIHDGSAETTLIPKKQKRIKANIKIFIICFKLIPLIKRSQVTHNPLMLLAKYVPRKSCAQE